MTTSSSIPNLRRISPQDKSHYFFGYYDVPAFNEGGDLHLAHRVRFWERPPRASDVAEIGVIERAKSTFTPLAQTTAWNFQQGAMLQWFPSDSGNEIIFNIREKSTFGSRILNIANGKTRDFPMPVSNVDSQGRYALGINFSRLYDFRPGYGYAGFTDRWKEANHPEDDGIYLLDFRDGSVKLILSLQQIWEFTHQWMPPKSQKILVNHITFNPSGTRFVALVRYFPIGEKQRRTAVITANADGSDLRMIKENYIVASHYHWRDDETLMIYADGEQGLQLYEWNAWDGAERALNTSFFLRDGHCSYSPDRKFVLYDSYPDQERYQHLAIYNLEQGAAKRYGKLYSYRQREIDIRCDLHPRWNRTGDIISLDSNHENRRAIYELTV